MNDKGERTLLAWRKMIHTFGDLRQFSDRDLAMPLGDQIHYI
jgi:hypothetical protein